MNFSRFVLLLLCLAVLLSAGCSRARKLRVGAKDFTENMILAEMVAILAEERGIPIERKLPHGSSFDCYRDVRGGVLDLYPEYNGTLDALEGRTESDRPSRDLVWKGGLGFQNGFALYVRPGFSVNGIEIRTISDLSQVADTPLERLRLGTIEEFPRRAADGLRPMLDAYGLEQVIRVEPDFVTDDRERLFAGLVDGMIDVAVGEETSGRAAELGLVPLEDDQNFFESTYEPGFLTREDALEEIPGLQEILDTLVTRGITGDEMRQLVREVDVLGATPADTAERFLREGKNPLLPPASGESRRADLVIAVPIDIEERGQDTAGSPVINRALRSVRHTAPGRRVTLNRVGDVRSEVVMGTAFIGIMAAEQFFDPYELQRFTDLEAVAPVGYRVAHVLIREGDQEKITFATIDRFGIGPQGGRSEQAGRMLANAYGHEADGITGPLEDQLTALRAGELDAVLVMAPEGASVIREALRGGEQGDGTLTLLDLEDWSGPRRAVRYPFFRKKVIPSGVYGVERPVETVTSQVVMAGPVGVRGGLGDGGPISAIGSERRAIPGGMARELRREVNLEVGIDPTLPQRDFGADQESRLPINPSPEVSLLTLIFFVSAGYFLWVLARTKPKDLSSQPTR